MRHVQVPQNRGQTSAQIAQPLKDASTPFRFIDSLSYINRDVLIALQPMEAVTRERRPNGSCLARVHQSSPLPRHGLVVGVRFRFLPASAVAHEASFASTLNNNRCAPCQSRQQKGDARRIIRFTNCDPSCPLKGPSLSLPDSHLAPSLSAQTSFTL